jgi:O-antigen/teichoic acid export membrane protein
MKLLARFREDELLIRVTQNSAHLFSSNSISLALSFLQGILAARLLGPSAFGLLGIVMSYAATLNGLLSFRMSELVVRYGGQYLENGENRKAAAVIKAAGIAELAVSVLAFLLVLVTAGVATRFIAKTPGSEWMFGLYALGLLANFNTETSTGVLQITERVKLRGTVNLVQSILSALVVVIAFALIVVGAIPAALGFVIVLVAYLLGKALLGFGLFLVAQHRLRQVLGRDWPSTSMSELPSIRSLAGFALSSNFSATAILIFRESEVLWVGLFLNPAAAGLYKIAYTIVGFLSVPADPLILSVYPEANRLIVQKAWRRLRGFLQRVTSLALAYNLLLAAGLVLLGRQILDIFGEQYSPAYPAMVALLVGLVFNYTLFWNRPLLLSLGMPAFALWAILISGALKMSLALWLVPRFGFVMEGVLLSLYYVLSVSLIVWRGLRELDRRELAAGVQAAA